MVVGLLLASAPGASAQGTEGFIADPISSATFNKYIDRLELGPTQQIAAEQFHEQYKNRYRELREGPIQDMIDEMREISAGGFEIPTKDMVEDLLKARASTMSKVENVDEELFDQIQTLLRAEQLPKLDRVRRAREREYCQMGIQMSDMGQGYRNLNLVEVVDQLQLSADQEAAIEPAVVEYEIDVNRALRVLQDKSFGMFVDLFDELERMGIDVEAIRDNPEQAQQAMRAFAEAMQNVRKKTAEAADRYDSVTEEYHERIRRELPAPYDEAFHRIVRRRVYDDVYPDHSSAERAFQESLELDDLSSQQRAAVELLRDQFVNEHERVCDRMVEAVDAQRVAQRERAFDFQFNNDSWEKHRETMEALRNERTEVNERYMVELKSRLSEELYTKVSSFRGPAESEHVRGSGGGRDLEIVAAGQARSAMTTAVNASSFGGLDFYMPHPISEGQFNTIAARLQLGPDQKTIAELNYEDYFDKYKTVIEEEVMPAMRAVSEDAMNEQGGMSIEGIERQNALRRQYLQQFTELDNTFIDSLNTVLNDEQRERLEAVKRSRTRQRYSMRQFQNWQGALDLAAVVDGLGLDAEAFDRVHEPLAEYEEKLLPLLEERFDIVMERELSHHRARRKWEELRAQADDGNVDWRQYQELFSAMEQQAQENAAKIKTLNEDAYHAISAYLPYRAGRQFQDRYRREMYPSVYPDPEDALPVIDDAMSVPGLTDEQLAQLDTIRMEHIEQHDGYSNDLIDLYEQDQIDWSTADEEVRTGWWERRQRIDRIEYERTELSATNLRRVRVVLTPEQAERVRGLN